MAPLRSPGLRPAAGQRRDDRLSCVKGQEVLRLLLLPQPQGPDRDTRRLRLCLCAGSCSACLPGPLGNRRVSSGHSQHPQVGPQQPRTSHCGPVSLLLAGQLPSLAQSRSPQAGSLGGNLRGQLFPPLPVCPQRTPSRPQSPELSLRFPPSGLGTGSRSYSPPQPLPHFSVRFHVERTRICHPKICLFGISIILSCLF